jgi:hypothetical protein
MVPRMSIRRERPSLGGFSSFSLCMCGPFSFCAGFLSLCSTVVVNSLEQNNEHRCSLSSSRWAYDPYGLPFQESDGTNQKSLLSNARMSHELKAT